MSFNATTFRSKLTGGGARPNLFKVSLSFPGNTGSNESNEEFSFMCRSASVPSLNVGVVNVPYFGRIIKLAGDRTFEDWNIRVFNDESYNVRKAFEKWQSRLTQLDHDTAGKEHIMTNGSYYIDVTVEQYSKGNGSEDPMGEVVKTYTLKNAWPSMIGAIELAWDSNDQIEEFDVTFSYDYFQSSGV